MNNKITFFLVFFSLFILLTGCGKGFFKKVDMRERPVNAQERARQNVEEGKGVSINKVLRGRGNTNFQFSSSNPLWRASLEILDFLPMTTVDYAGGMIISDWYSDNTNNSNESIKITIRFLSNEIRSDSLKVIAHKKTCKTMQSCNTVILENSAIGQELVSSIIRKAAILDKADKEKK
mgnify:FL=1|tara:strand:- start:49 stop:582 length:534 start_codon:yes stop_codon:yes gene_type:complete